MEKKKSKQTSVLSDKDKGIVLFDGFCNLCSWSVQFILKRDKRDYFRFASLQSEIAGQLLKDFNIPKGFYLSVILIEGNSVYFKSDAVLRITRKLRRLWPIFYSFILFPKFLRNYIYDYIARNRFKWFGKKATCYLPEKDYSYRFL